MKEKYAHNLAGVYAIARKVRVLTIEKKSILTPDISEVGARAERAFAEQQERSALSPD